MEYIVLNLDGNRMNGKVTQIGAARVDEKLDVLDTFRMKMDPAETADFADAMEKFRLWCGDAPLVTWGQDDIWLLEDCISENGLNLDWKRTPSGGSELCHDGAGHEAPCREECADTVPAYGEGSAESQFRPGY